MTGQVRYRKSIDYKPGEIASLTRRALTGKYIPHNDPAQAGCIAAFPFGHRKVNGNLVPGISNHALAALISTDYPDLPVVAPFEVDDALRDFGMKSEVRLGTPGVFFETKAVAKAIASVIKTSNLLSNGPLLVIGHQYHLPRCDATMQAELPCGESTIVPAGIEIPWDPQSTQLWTRSPLYWALREPAAIGRYAAFGWLDLQHAV